MSASPFGRMGHVLNWFYLFNAGWETVASWSCKTASSQVRAQLPGADYVRADRHAIRLRHKVFHLIQEDACVVLNKFKHTTSCWAVNLLPFNLGNFSESTVRPFFIHRCIVRWETLKSFAIWGVGQHSLLQSKAMSIFVFLDLIWKLEVRPYSTAN